MRYFFSLLLVALLAFAILPASAQMSIDKVETQQESIRFPEKIKIVPVEVGYFSPARYRAERAAIRKERNYLEIGGALQGTLTSFNDPWIKVSGGDNSIAAMATFLLRHTYKKELFSVETKVDAKFGYNRIKVEMKDAEGKTSSNGIWFKNQDEFAISIAPALKMTKNWSYGATFKFRSQFTTGYVSRTEQKEEHMKSTFMTPGYLDVSLGVTYRSPQPKFPIVINIAPIALSGLFVQNEDIRSRFSYGIEDLSKAAKYEGGSSVQIDFDRKFGKKEFLRYRTTIFTFFGWITDMSHKNKISDYSKYLSEKAKWDGKEPPYDKQNISDKPRLPIHPTVRWENTIELKATKYLSTTFSFQLYYNRAQNVDIQTQMFLSVGLAYTFKNK